VKQQLVWREQVGVSRKQKLLAKVLSGSDNVQFADVVKLAELFGFTLVRVRGSHHIFAHPDLRELLNLQKRGGQAKPYQIRQLLTLLEDNDFSFGDEK
jgi:predicted RNA binding protein YcfA (HicA-like mRNA interferase family)